MFSLLFSWYYQPFIADGQTNSLAASVFDLRGVAFACWTLLAFAIGGVAGLLIRRVVPALVATLATYAGLVLVVGLFLRQHYLTPLTARQQSLTVSAFVTGNWGTKGGRTVFSFTGEPTNNVLGQFCPSGRDRQAVVGTSGGIRAVSRPARLHALGQLPAGQPVLALPVDRGRLAAGAVSATHCRDRVAGPAPGNLKTAAWGWPSS